MIVTVVTANQPGRIVFQGELAAAQLHRLAESFIADAKESQVRKLMRNAFGKWNFRKYALNQSGRARCTVTYSVLSNPDLLYHQGSPVAVADIHSVPFQLHVHTCDIVQMDSVPAKAPRPFNVGE